MEGWKFRRVVIYLVDHALRLRSSLSHSCTKLGNRDFESKFVERIENSTL